MSGGDRHARRHPDAASAQRSQAFVDLMIPIVKGWCTEIGVDDRVPRRAGPRRHGLHRGDRGGPNLRDARITPIYEGTTGIQANDLVGRKIAREAGEAIARHRADA